MGCQFHQLVRWCGGKSEGGDDERGEKEEGQEGGWENGERT